MQTALKPGLLLLPAWHEQGKQVRRRSQSLQMVLLYEGLLRLEATRNSLRKGCSFNNGNGDFGKSSSSRQEAEKCRSKLGQDPGI